MKKESCPTTWVDPKTVVVPYSDPKTSPLGPKKDKNNPKIKSNSNVTIQGIIENESCSTVFEPFPNPKNSPLGPQKVKNDPKINQNQISELTETHKTKVEQLHEQTQEQFSNPNPTSKIAH